MSMRGSNQHRLDKILNAKATYMISKIKSNNEVKNIIQPLKLNHFEPTILKNRVYHNKSKQIAHHN